MVTKVVWDLSGAEHVIDWSWAHGHGDYWIEIELVDDQMPDLTDDQRLLVEEVCANEYPLSKYQEESAMDVDYYDR